MNMQFFLFFFAAISVSTPPLWMGNALIWLTQLETQFSANRIQSGSHQLSVLPLARSDETKDLIIAHAETILYQGIRLGILKSMSK